VIEGSVPPLSGEHDGVVWPDAFAFSFASYLGCEPDDVLAGFGPGFRLHWRWAGTKAHSNILERRAALRCEVKSAATSRALQELDLIADLLTGVSNRSRGRNAQAHMLAFGVARIFERLGRDITFGAHPDMTRGERHKEWKVPSTVFGWSVLQAIELTGLEPERWQAPTRAAAKAFSR
jgi:hypothetical protein